MANTVVASRPQKLDSKHAESAIHRFPPVKKCVETLTLRGGHRFEARALRSRLRVL